MKKKRIYISGPISGRPKAEYRAHFDQAAKHLRAQGHRPVNPTRLWGWFQPLFNCLPYRWQILFDCIALSHCQGIYLLTGWSRSHGARLEHTIAAWLGLPEELENPIHHE